MERRKILEDNIKEIPGRIMLSEKTLETVSVSRHFTILNIKIIVFFINLESTRIAQTNDESNK